jgi:hypothetical protein
MSRLTILAAALIAVVSVPDSKASPLFLRGIVDWPGSGASRVIDAGGDDAATLRGVVPSAVIGPVKVMNAHRVLDVSQSAVVSQINVDGVEAQVTDGCIRAHADIVVVRSTHCVMTGGPQSGGVNMPFGFEVTAARTVLVENSSFDGFQWTAAPNRYWNGDGITIEKDVAGAQFRGVSANNNSDAGFDVRPFAILSDVSAAGNCRNFRFWSGADAGTLTTGDSVKRGGISSCSGIWLNGSSAGPRPRLHVARLVVRMRNPGTIIEVETGPADIRIDHCDIQAPAGTRMIEFDKGAGSVELGVGCRLGVRGA